MKYRFFLVHGTFAKNTPWIKDNSSFSQHLKSRIEGDVIFESFNWSGGNSHSSRIQAAEDLLKRLKAHVADQEEKKIIIAHSHGGNIAMYALGNLGLEASAFHLITLATPFLNVSKRAHEFYTWLISVLIPLSFFLLINAGLELFMEFVVKRFVILADIITITISIFLFPQFYKKINRKANALNQKVDLIVKQLSIPADIDKSKLLVIIDRRDEISIWFRLLSRSLFVIDGFQTVTFFYSLMILGLSVVVGLYDIGTSLFTPSYQSFQKRLFIGITIFLTISVASLFIILITTLITSLLYILLRSNIIMLGSESWYHRVFIKIKPSVVPEGYINQTTKIKHSSSLFRYSLKHSIYNEDGVIDYIVKWISDGIVTPDLIQSPGFSTQDIENMFLLFMSVGINPRYFFLDIGMIPAYEAKKLIKRIKLYRKEELKDIDSSQAIKILERLIALLCFHDSKEVATAIYKKIFNCSFNQADHAVNEVLIKYSIVIQENHLSIYKRRWKKKIRALKLLIPSIFFTVTTGFIFFRLWLSKSLLVNLKFSENVINRLLVDKIFVWHTLSFVDVILLSNIFKLFLSLYALFSGRNTINFDGDGFPFGFFVLLAIILESFVFGKALGFEPERMYGACIMIFFIVPGVAMALFFNYGKSK